MLICDCVSVCMWVCVCLCVKYIEKGWVNCVVLSKIRSSYHFVSYFFSYIILCQYSGSGTANQSIFACIFFCFVHLIKSEEIIKKTYWRIWEMILCKCFKISRNVQHRNWLNGAIKNQWNLVATVLCSCLMNVMKHSSFNWIFLVKHFPVMILLQKWTYSRILRN